MAMAGMCCTLQAKANVQPVPQDSVHYESYMEKELMFQTAEPTYHKGVLVTSPWNGNWFVSLQGGASAFIGRPIRISRQMVHSTDRGKNRVWRLAVQGLQPYCQ